MFCKIHLILGLIGIYVTNVHSLSTGIYEGCYRENRESDKLVNKSSPIENSPDDCIKACSDDYFM